ncbi:hypothetical protein GGF32_005866 [Allomyces javanicus]|nr:hypothetical protein GGF32_005866 [Allomyces javanicus]
MTTQLLTDVLANERLAPTATQAININTKVKEIAAKYKTLNKMADTILVFALIRTMILGERSFESWWFDERTSQYPAAARMGIDHILRYLFDKLTHEESDWFNVPRSLWELLDLHPRFKLLRRYFVDQVGEKRAYDAFRAATCVTMRRDLFLRVVHDYSTREWVQARVECQIGAGLAPDMPGFCLQQAQLDKFELMTGVGRGQIDLIATIASVLGVQYGYQQAVEDVAAARAAADAALRPDGDGAEDAEDV